MNEPEDAERTESDQERSRSNDPYDAAPTHDPAFPSWRYAGAQWLADRLYRRDRTKDRRRGHAWGGARRRDQLNTTWSSLMSGWSTAMRSATQRLRNSAIGTPSER